MPEPMRMKNIDVPRLTELNAGESLSRISEQLDSLDRIPIRCLPWESFTYTPRVFFSIAYHDAIYIKYYVQEDHLRIAYHNPNDPVYNDSCVEFFIALDDSQQYYNLEFNPAGTCLLAYGVNRNNRTFADPCLIRQIRSETRIRSEYENGEKSFLWELTLVIPFGVFSFHDISTLRGMKARANFYKCGEHTTEKHYLAWNCIQSAELDFHQPEHFGSLKFQ
jgi:hypothetical protein